MKIKINDKEEYNFDLANGEIDFTEFVAITNRFNALIKFLGKDDMLLAKRSYIKKGEKAEEQPTTRTRINRDLPFLKDRTEAVKLMRIFYLEDKTAKNNYAQQLGVTWSKLKEKPYFLKKKFNITAKEVGIKAYPGTGKRAEPIDEKVLI